MKYALGKGRKHCGKSIKENAGCQHFLLFPQCFQKAFSTMFSEGFFLRVVKTLPSDKILYWSKLKALADINLNKIQKLKFVLGRVEKIVGNGENAGYQHFLLFPQCFQKAFSFASLKFGIVW